MTKVIISEDCGNSPKNIFVQELTIAFAKGDLRFILDKVTDDVRWTIVGDSLIEGKEKIMEMLEQMKNDKAEELTIQHIATHGNAGAVDGKMKFKNGKTVAYCNVYEFSNAKGTSVKEITSYEIESK
jgi:limonene-1,2-epoxide hydrolase